MNTNSDFLTMDDALDWLRYHVLNETTLLSPALQHRALLLVRDIAKVAGIVLPADWDAFEAERMADLETQGARRLAHNRRANPAAYVRLNPFLQSVSEMHQVLGGPEVISKYTINNWRYAIRAQRYSPVDKRGAARLLHGKAEPTHLTTGNYYSEAFALSDGFPAATNARLHVRSPWYLFHAQAWGRRLYATWLDHASHGMCVITQRTSDYFRASNPDDGTGFAYILLAKDYFIRARPKRISTVALPIPDLATSAHCSKWLEPGRQGTTMKRLFIEINAELESLGLPALERASADVL